MNKEERAGGTSSLSLERAEGLVREAIRAGAGHAEAYLKQSATTEIFLGGPTENLSEGRESGAALRVFDEKGRVGYAASSFIESSGEKALVRQALAALRRSAESGGAVEPALPLPGPCPSLAVPAGLVHPAVTAWDVKRKRDIAGAALQELRGEGGGTTTRYRDGRFRITLCNSRGFVGIYEKTLALLRWEWSREGAPLLSAEWVGNGPDPVGTRVAAAELRRLQPEGEEEQIEPEALFLLPDAATTLLRLMVSDRLFEAPPRPPRGSPRREATADAGEGDLRRRLASECVSVVDDGLLPGGVGSAPFDGEGVPSGKLMLVRAGIRIDRLRPRRSGEMDRPGTALRVSYRDLPVTGGTNLHVVPGIRSEEQILRDLSRGFLIASLRPDPGGARNPGGGRWHGIGWEIRAGAPAGRCRALTFQAPLSTLWEGVGEVASRPRFYIWRGFAVGAPGLLIRLSG